MLLKDFDRFGKYRLAVKTFERKETDLTVVRIAFVEAFEGNALAVTDPVVREITEDDGLRTGSDFRRIRSGEIRSAENSADLAFLESGLEQIVPGGILELADRLDSVVIQNPDGFLAIRSLEAVVEIDEFVRRDPRCACGRDTDLTTAGRIENTRGFARAVAGDLPGEDVLVVVDSRSRDAAEGLPQPDRAHG